ncbi:PAS domain-containing protein [Bradyrhizobium sp. CCBAU 51745]|uniref:PAS domain-containing protein n=1 Tax=Bradyrhizobium sp. CCBAU 51745 TaxID=1325099 RepID=UPI002304E229|nr:PAS domain-containing protein [Bradyrhizobium sp. CCBAU 51745]
MKVSATDCSSPDQELTLLEFDDSISLADILPFIEEKLSIGLWRSNDKGQMQWSRGFYELFGLDPRQTGPSPAEIERRIHPDDRGRVRWLNQRSIEHGMLEDEFRIIRPNGTLRRIWARAEPLLDPAGTRNGCLGLLPMSPKSATCRRLSILQRSAASLWPEALGDWSGRPVATVT